MALVKFNSAISVNDVWINPAHVTAVSACRDEDVGGTFIYIANSGRNPWHVCEHIEAVVQSLNMGISDA